MKFISPFISKSLLSNFDIESAEMVFPDPDSPIIPIFEALPKVKFRFETSPIEYVADRKGHDFRYAISSNLAKTELGFEITRNLSSEIDGVIDYYKRNLQIN